MQFIDLSAQLAAIRQRIDTRIQQVLDHGAFILGPEVQQLEQALADYTGVPYCVTCANGTDALTLALAALDIGPGDVVFTSAFSFFATAEVIPQAGATPWFVDIEPDSYNLCRDSLEQAIKACLLSSTGRPKAVIAVDLFGCPADYDRIQRLCEQYGLLLIEDAAQGFGGTLNGKKTGNFGQIATTSFFPAKPLGCYGDGGALFCHDQATAEHLLSLRVHGKGRDKYDNVRLGYNSRLDTIQAAVLLEKLAIFDAELVARQHIAKRYQKQLAPAFQIPQPASNMTSSWAQFTIRGQKDRAHYQQGLQKAGIPTAVYYPIPLHQQTALQHYPAQPCPQSELAAQQVFSLPMHPYLTDDEIDCVCTALNALNQ